jgi:hypothetical protein
VGWGGPGARGGGASYWLNEQQRSEGQQLQGLTLCCVLIVSPEADHWTILWPHPSSPTHPPTHPPTPTHPRHTRHPHTVTHPPRHQVPPHPGQPAQAGREGVQDPARLPVQLHHLRQLHRRDLGLDPVHGWDADGGGGAVYCGGGVPDGGVGQAEACAPAQGVAQGGWRRGNSRGGFAV